MTASLRHRLLIVAACSIVLLQICWPLLTGSSRAVLTVVTVVLFAGVSVTHAALTFGGWWALRFAVITFAFSMLVEAVGSATSVVFGSYEYSGQLGPQVFGVPVVIGLAWVMFAYPAWILARTLALSIGSRAGRLVVSVLIAALTMTAWDLFLDPQMVAEGYWRWSGTGLEFPGTYGIGVHNYLGWFVTSAILMLMIATVPEPRDRVVDQRVPVILLSWTWLGGIVGNLFFFGRPAVALTGGIAMGILVVPYLFAVRRSSEGEAVR